MVHIDWGAVLTPVLQYLLPILAVALITWLSAKAAQEWSWFKSKYPMWASVLEEIAPIAVGAAEQLRLSGKLPTAQAALDYATQAVQLYLNAHGLKDLDVKLIVTAIENAVLKLPPTTPQLAPKPPVG